MERQFWEDRWDRGEIGFHMGAPHHDLVRHFDRLRLTPGARVLVPLCGKSHDLVWLAAQGQAVLGVELSPRAVADFFAEQKLAPGHDRIDGFARYRAGAITLLCGDIFALRPEQTADVAGVFDRGALVALPPPMRRRYAAQLATLLPAGSRVLLVSYAYDQAQMPGPPFAVPPAEVAALFGMDFTIEPLEARDALPTHPVLGERGLTALTEYVSLLTRR